MSASIGIGANMERSAITSKKVSNLQVKCSSSLERLPGTCNFGTGESCGIVASRASSLQAYDGLFFVDDAHKNE